MLKPRRKLGCRGSGREHESAYDSGCVLKLWCVLQRKVAALACQVSHPFDCVALLFPPLRNRKPASLSYETSVRAKPSSRSTTGAHNTQGRAIAEHEKIELSGRL